MRPDVGYAFSTSELVYSKKFVSGSFKISNCDRSSDRFFFFYSIILINPASWCGVYSRPAFINISVPKFSVYSNKYDVEGFPAQRKAATSHEKKCDIFHVWLISPISFWDVSRLSRYSVRFMNERRSLYQAQSYMVVCWNFLRLWLLKHWKILIAYREWRSNFPRRGRKSKCDQKNRKLRIQWL